MYNWINDYTDYNCDNFREIENNTMKKSRTLNKV